MFGGSLHTNESTNIVYIFDFIARNWRKVKPNIDVPNIDSHSAVEHSGQMYVYGGYIPSKAEFLLDIYAFDLEKEEWRIEYKNTGGRNEP